MNTFVLYFNQCKEDLGPQKKLLMVFHSPHWLTYYIFFSEAEIYRAERILFYPLFNWTLILSCSDMYYFFYKDFIPLFFCFVGKFLTIFSSEFLQPVCSFPLLSEKNNGKRGERVMVDRKSNFWLSSHLTPGHSAHSHTHYPFTQVLKWTLGPWLCTHFLSVRRQSTCFSYI